MSTSQQKHHSAKHGYPTKFRQFGGLTNINIDNKPAISVHRISGYTRTIKKTIGGKFQDHTIQSVFQPIYSLSHQRAIGYEALARVFDDDQKRINPATFFGSIEDEYSLVVLDRLCRSLHLQNFSRFEDNLNWVFLNTSPRVAVVGRKYGSFFNELLSSINIPARQIVVEIIEHEESEMEQLEDTVEYFRSLGCLIAIDDFGTGYSNFERIWSLKPDIIKLDRSMIQQASTSDKIRGLLPGIVSLLHQSGTLVLIEGVENKTQAMIALECDADFVQGFYFSRPVSHLEQIKSNDTVFKHLFNNYNSMMKRKSKDSGLLIERYKKVFMDTVEKIKEGQSLNCACNELFKDQSIVRGFLLGDDGIQIGETVQSNIAASEKNLKLRPIQSAERANWIRRHYVQRAYYHPSQIQISRPYLSITGAHMCMTLSMMFDTPTGELVFCCDVDLG